MGRIPLFSSKPHTIDLVEDSEELSVGLEYSSVKLSPMLDAIIEV